MTVDVALPAWVQDPVALRVVAALADGRSLPVSMLTAETGLGADVVAETLSRLADADVVAVIRDGRWAYHRLIADLDPDLVAAAPLPASSRPGTALHAVRAARRCYGHPAGRLGVAITDALRRLGHLSGPTGDGPEHRLTSDGLGLLSDLEFPLPSELTARLCVDWTERRHHLAGAPGRCLLAGMVTHGWVSAAATPRALVVTDAGRAALQKHLSLTWD